MANCNWVLKARVSDEYYAGVVEWVRLKFEQEANNKEGGRILCPCAKCRCLWTRSDEVLDHLVIYGFRKDHEIWSQINPASREKTDRTEGEGEEMHEMLHDVLLHGDDPEEQELVKEDERFRRLMADATRELYPGCSASKLSFAVRIFNMKCVNHWSDKSFDDLMILLKDIMPKDSFLPSTFRETKSMVAGLGFAYDRIDCCSNDCRVFESDEQHACDVCGASRWEQDARSSDKGATSSYVPKNVAAKTLRYLPIAPPLQLLFKSRKTAAAMIWHHSKRIDDDGLRHPADSKAWKHLDMKYPEFSQDPRNIRLALCTDGFTPFKYGSSHTIWPVVLAVYNLPPWSIMKKSNLIVPLIIPGPHMPGNDLDIFLRPLIEELKSLFHTGVRTYDAATDSFFTLRVALPWTVGDFLAYAYLSGWSTKGKMACPICMGGTRSKSVRSKICYVGHRCFLKEDHPYRFNKEHFDGQEDHSKPPRELTGTEIFEEIRDLDVIFGKKNKSTIPKSSSSNWRKRSIFFELPYWEHLLV